MPCLCVFCKDGSDARLAPLYDVTSALPYPGMNVLRLRLAMKIGGEYSLRVIGRRHWERLARDVGRVKRCGTGDRWLLLEYQRRSAYSLPFEVDYHFDAVGDLYQGDAFVHAVILAVEGHRSFNLA
jgi:hypothetical protein